MRSVLVLVARRRIIDCGLRSLRSVSEPLHFSDDEKELNEVTINTTRLDPTEWLASSRSGERVRMLGVGSDQLDDDDLALMHATAREHYPSQAQSPFSFVLVISDLCRAVAKAVYRSGKWAWRHLVQRNASADDPDLPPRS